MYSIKQTVTTSKTDRNGQLKLFSAFQMMQDCSEMWIESEPTVKKYFGQQNMTQLLASREVEVVRVPSFLENLTICTGVFDCKEVYGFRNTFIYDEYGNVCYKSWSMGAFIDKTTGRLSKLSEEVIHSIIYDEKLDMNYGERRIRLPQSETETFPEVLVQRNDIDYNGHLNNAHYIRIALEYLPEDFTVHGIRVEYKKAMRLGELITPKIIRGNKTFYVMLYSENTVSAIIEFN